MVYSLHANMALPAATLCLACTHTSWVLYSAFMHCTHVACRGSTCSATFGVDIRTPYVTVTQTTIAAIFSSYVLLCRLLSLEALQVTKLPHQLRHQAAPTGSTWGPLTPPGRLRTCCTPVSWEMPCTCQTALCSFATVVNRVSWCSLFHVLSHN